ncbi:helix-turn-helix domain-containing protein [Leptolyngbya sp. AN03gr2]|uniref:helix-turn-helix domain-containing protein n=1 Tax=unclassified Leptolyngbya TaxID=2650499 RepID=UPI003D3204B4
MDSHEISKPQALATKLREQFPEATGEFGESTVRLILSNTIDRISQTGLISLCRFFKLKSLSQLVDFDDAAEASFGTLDYAPKMRLRFKLQSLLTEKDIPQKEFAEHCMISVATVNRFCRGSSDKISFDALIKIAAALRLYTYDENPEPWAITPNSISDLLELEMAGTRTEHPALEQGKRSPLPAVRITTFQDEAATRKPEMLILPVQPKRIEPSDHKATQPAHSPSAPEIKKTPTLSKSTQTKSKALQAEVHEETPDIAPKKRIPSYREPVRSIKSVDSIESNHGDAEMRESAPQSDSVPRKPKQYILYK